MLLSIYAYKVRTSGGQPNTWNPPSLSVSSIYHTVDGSSRGSSRRRPITQEDSVGVSLSSVFYLSIFILTSVLVCSQFTLFCT